MSNTSSQSALQAVMTCSQGFSQQNHFLQRFLLQCPKLSENEFRRLKYCQYYCILIFFCRPFNFGFYKMHVYFSHGNPFLTIFWILCSFCRPIYYSVIIFSRLKRFRLCKYSSPGCSSILLSTLLLFFSQMHFVICKCNS